MAVAHTNLNGHFEDRFARGISSKPEFNQRLFPLAATQEERRAWELLRKRGIWVRWLSSLGSLCQKALKDSSGWGCYALGYFIYGCRCWEQLPGIWKASRLQMAENLTWTMFQMCKSLSLASAGFRADGSQPTGKKFTTYGPTSKRHLCFINVKQTLRTHIHTYLQDWSCTTYGAL